jgi:RNA polymerase sigma factor (TIGR02999 family)
LKLKVPAGSPDASSEFALPNRIPICYTSDVSEITQVLHAMQRGDAAAGEELMKLVYDELRRMAASRMRREAPGNTLQPTALVHEAWLRLGGDKQPAWNNQMHFFGAAAEAMRRILIDRARRRNAERRGGGRTHVPIDGIEIGGAANDPHLLEVNEAFERFARREPKKAELVRLRYFIGLQLDESAHVLGISEATAKRWWIFARAWLYRELNPDV